MATARAILITNGQVINRLMEVQFIIRSFTRSCFYVSLYPDICLPVLLAFNQSLPTAMWTNVARYTIFGGDCLIAISTLEIARLQL